VFLKIGLISSPVFVLSLFVLANMPTDIFIAKIFHVTFAVSGIAMFVFLFLLGIMPVVVTFWYEHGPYYIREYFKDSGFYSQLIIRPNK